MRHLVTQPASIRHLVALITVLLLSAACSSFDDPGGSSATAHGVSVVTIGVSDTQQDIVASYGGEVVVWRPKEGFAILGGGAEEQLAESGALRAWAGALRAWAGALRAWAGGELGEDGVVLAENAAIWERLSLERAHRALAPKLGRGVVVAVLDTGLDLSHPSFKGRLDRRANWYDFVTSDLRPQEARGAAYGHGTAVASIVLQVAPKAKIMPLRVLNGDGQGRVADVAAAIDRAVARGADIIQLSLGTEAPSEALEQMVAYAAAQGVYVVTSAGNSDGALTYPAYSAMLATPTGDMAVGVGSVNLNDQKSWFSNFASDHGNDDGLEMVSFGEDVYAAFPGDRVAAWDGTSVAAPMVAGALALAIAEGAESLNPRQLGLKVVSSALEIDAEGSSGGQEFELERRLELSLFLCDALNLAADMCNGTTEGVDGDDDSDDGDDDSGDDDGGDDDGGDDDDD